MNKIGLCSITFRDLSVTEVIKLAKEAKLDGIEWGADKHVIPTDLKNAEIVAKQTNEAGLEVASYGSYYRVGEIDNNYSFEDILKTTLALKTNQIRVWAGRLSSMDTNDIKRQAVINDGKRIAQLAFKHQIKLSFEYHSKTLTDNLESALNLIKEINEENVYLYWQPEVELSFQERMFNLKTVKEYVSNVHVFYWEELTRYPLELGFLNWQAYFKELNLSLKESRYYLLEFVKDDDPQQFLLDAKVLKRIISNE